MSNNWECGTPKSRGNAFDWRNWELQCDWGQLTTAAKLRAAQAERVERDRARGVTFTIHGLSPKSDTRAAATRTQWHGGVYSRA